MPLFTSTQRGLLPLVQLVSLAGARLLFFAQFIAQSAQQLLPPAAIGGHVQPGLFGADGCAGLGADESVWLADVVAARE